MDDKLLDPTLIGVIIGSFLSLVGNVITQYFSNKKEAQQWERQRISSREEREEKSKSQDIEYLRELYHKCVLSLSVYLSSLQDKNHKEEGKSQSDEIKEIHYWLSLLLLRHPHKKLSKLIDNFLFDPDEHNAEHLRKYALDLVEQEENLSASNPIKENADKSEANEAKTRTITFRISEDYRRQQIMVSGVELPQSHFYPYELENLNTGQRERLLKIYFQSYKRIPENALLSLPIYMPDAKQIRYQGKSWEAQTNPLTSNVNEILDQWGVDFDKYLEEAEQVLAQNA